MTPLVPLPAGSPTATASRSWTVGVLEPVFDVSRFALNTAQVFKRKGVKNESTRLYIHNPCNFLPPGIGMRHHAILYVRAPCGCNVRPIERECVDRDSISHDTHV